MLGEVSAVSAYFFLENVSARCEHGHFTETLILCVCVWGFFFLYFLYRLHF